MPKIIQIAVTSDLDLYTLDDSGAIHVKWSGATDSDWQKVTLPEYQTPIQANPAPAAAPAPQHPEWERGGVNHPCPK